MNKLKRGPGLDKRLATTLRGYRVYTVNAFEVRSRTRHDEEFTNFAIPSDFPSLLAPGEIWVDARLYEAEGLYSLANAMVHLKGLEDGVPEDRAYRAGLEAERRLREALSGVKFRDGKPHRRVPAPIYLGHYASLPDPAGPVEARLVDGNRVRCTYRTDYVEGGHGHVYPWVPMGEVWLEQGVDLGELPFVLAHEYTELRLMRDDGLEYDAAHAIAAKVEFALREGDKLRDFVAPRGRGFTKADVVKLTTVDFFAAVRHRYRHR